MVSHEKTRTGSENMEPNSKAIAPKVAAGGLAGSLSIILVYALSEAGVTLPPEVASALTVVISFIGGYLKSS